MVRRPSERSKIAVIGGGISGLVTAYLLHQAHGVTLFEASNEVGGHTSTVQVESGGRAYNVDAGFVVYNEVTYPNFVRLLDRLSVDTEPTSMSFSVRCDRTGLEYCGTSLNTIFAQRRNLLRPSFYRVLRDITRFNRDARRLLADKRDELTLRRFLEQQRYGRGFVERYIIPMTAAIWSASPARTLDFPAHFFIRFFHNHGLLGMAGHLQWRVISGGSRRYVEPLIESFRERIRTSTPVQKVRRLADGVEITPAGLPAERYDEVVLATHSDQALGLLADPTEAERHILSAIPYQRNEALLHTDSSLLPSNRRARASWNYRIPADSRDHATVTYHMSRLQNLDTEEPICLSLNEIGTVEPSKVISRMEFSHPLFLPASLEAQNSHGEISGVNHTHYCGAYWRNGFHEDGVVSALNVCSHFGIGLQS